jgi:MFS family permease
MILGNHTLKILYIANGIFVAAATMLTPIYALFAEDIGASLFTISMLATVFLGVKCIGSILVRFLGDRIPQQHLLMAHFLIHTVGWMSLAFITSVAGLFIIQIALALGDSMGSPAFSALFAEHLDAHKEIADYATWSLLSTGGSMFGAAAGGYIVYAFGFPCLFGLMSIMACVAFFTVFLSRITN